MRGIMIQGVSSDCGKSFLVTALCRLFVDRGVRICPFKSQNMSNNACVTPDGLEMSRAQAVQAEAARLEPATFMNPILLKPRRDTSSEIILNGRALDFPAERGLYRKFTQSQGIESVREALAHIGKNFDAVVIEGAGSPAEINLNATEIVNMRIAREADVPVLLAVDVDRGGSLAGVVGTLELIGLANKEDRARVKGIIFNKFRGDPRLFDDAVSWIQDYTGVPVIGVMPWVRGAAIAGEDSLSLHWAGDIGGRGSVNIGVVRFPSVANFTDLDPFEAESDVALIGLDENTHATQELDAVILPGVKNTMRDMAWLESTGLADEIRELSKIGRFVFGLCGGYQMLGEQLLDPELRENTELREIAGLGLFPTITQFIATDKRTVRTTGIVSLDFAKFAPDGSSAPEIPVMGYEIHFGKTKLSRPNVSQDVVPLFLVSNAETSAGVLPGTEGLARQDFSVAGSYLHGVFESDSFRALWLNAVRKSRGLPMRPVIDTRVMKETAYDTLARVAEENLDIATVTRLMGLA